MPISWATPIPGERIGPGYPLIVTTGVIGPIPVTAQWTFFIFDALSGEDVVYGFSTPVQSNQHQLSVIIDDPALGEYTQQGYRANVQADTDVRVVVTLANNSQVIDTDTQTLKWDPTGRLFADPALQATGGGQGSFTPTDRQTIETTEMAVQADFPRQIGALPDLLLGLGDLVDHIGVQLVVPGTEILISGRGSLDRPAGPIAINAYGLTWRFAELLPGLGYRDGAVATFYDRILQLVRVDVDRDSNEYLGEVFDIRTEGGRIVWGFGIPRRLLYDVLPGCVVGVRWLLL